jgi:hypothetical protein
MKIVRLIFLFLPFSCGFAFCQSTEKSDSDDIVEIARSRNIELPDLPWHLMAIWWNFQSPIPDFNRLDIDVTIDRDIPETYNLYISPINAAFNDATFYGGLQTNIGGWKSKNEHTMMHPGKGGIFSRWSKDKKEPIGLDYVDMFDNGLCESAGYEGEFCSVRRPYSWTKGTYTLSLIKEETVLFKKTPHTWVALEFTNKKNLQTYRIGRLLFEGETLIMRKNFAAFVEIYGFTKKVPKAKVTFGYPRINGKELPTVNVTASHSISGITGSPNVANVTTENKNVIISISSDVRPQPAQGQTTKVLNL